MGKVRHRSTSWKRFFKTSAKPAEGRKVESPIRSFADASAQLDRLTTFDPAYFEGDEQFSQDVCDLVLALAVVYCDLRDLWLARLLLSRDDVAVPKAITPTYGDYSGLSVHALRLTAGLLDELLDLLWKKREVLQGAPFRRLVLLMSEESRQSWETIEAVAMKSRVPGSLADCLSRIRNQVGYHYYDTTALREAFSTRFADAEGSRVPLLSRGRSLVTSRFFFADAALEHFLIAANLEEALDALLNPMMLLDHVRQALYSVVVNFLDERGGTRPWPEE